MLSERGRHANNDDVSGKISDCEGNRPGDKRPGSMQEALPAAAPRLDVAHKAAVPPLLHPDAGNVRQVGSGDDRRPDRTGLPHFEAFE